MLEILKKIDIKTLKEIIFPLSFVYSNIVNVIIYYLGFNFESNPVRFIISNTGYVLFALLCLYVLFKSNIKELKPKHFVISGILIAFYVFCFIEAFTKYGMNSTVINYFKLFISISLPCFVGGICGGQSDNKRFFNILESLSFIVFPYALVYFNGMVFDCLPWEDGSYLGYESYMAVAYNIMPFLIAHIICFVRNDKGLLTPIKHKELQHSQFIRAITIAIYWLGIMGSATRGTIICVLVSSLVVILFLLIQKKWKNLKTAVILNVLIFGILLFNMYAWAPAGFSRLQRAKTFVSGLQEHELVTSVDRATITDEDLDELVDSDDYEYTSETHDVIRNRGTIYKLAIKEFKKSPITGMGATGYSVKYGQYPHNAILELLCEKGIIVASIYLLSLIVFIIKVLRNAKLEPINYFILAFFVAYACRSNISGSFWDCPKLLIFWGFAISQTSLFKKEMPLTNKEKINA